MMLSIKFMFNFVYVVFILDQWITLKLHMKQRESLEPLGLRVLDYSQYHNMCTINTMLKIMLFYITVLSILVHCDSPTSDWPWTVRQGLMKMSGKKSQRLRSIASNNFRWVIEGDNNGKEFWPNKGPTISTRSNRPWAMCWAYGVISPSHCRGCSDGADQFGPEPYSWVGVAGRVCWQGVVARLQLVHWRLADWWAEGGT